MYWQAKRTTSVQLPELHEQAERPQAASVSLAEPARAGASSEGTNNNFLMDSVL
jgi:hypothetical protein